MWWSTGVSGIGRIEDRISSLYLDKTHVDRTRNSITVADAGRTVRIPASLLGTLMLGPGVTITHAAIVLLADSGTQVCWVGENAVRFYASGKSTTSGSSIAERHAWLVSRPRERMRVARAMYGIRFPGEDVSRVTMQQLLGREGSRVRRIYRENSRRTGVEWTGRSYVPGRAFDAGDDVNRLLSAGNTALYGICNAAICGLGAVPALGFIHCGLANSFVLDIADLYKHETSIPIAFNLAASGCSSERDARRAMRDKVVEFKLMTRVVHDVIGLLSPATAKGLSDPTTDGHDPTANPGALWSPEKLFVSGVNYSDEQRLNGDDDGADGQPW